MPEKVKRIRSREEASSLRKRLFLIGGLAVLAGVLFVIGFTGEKPPEKAVQVKNQEMAAVTCVSGECFQVNSDGAAFASSPRTGGSLVFVIEYIKKDIPPDVLAELLFLRKRAQEELGVTFTLAKVNDVEPADFDLKTTDGWVVRVSIANNANATLEILRRVLDGLGSSRRNLEYIDLRLPNKVYYKLK